MIDTISKSPYISGPTDAGWSSLVARRAHNPKVVGSNPAPATKFRQRRSGVFSSANMMLTIGRLLVFDDGCFAKSAF